MARYRVQTYNGLAKGDILEFILELQTPNDHSEITAGDTFYIVYPNNSMQPDGKVVSRYATSARIEIGGTPYDLRLYKNPGNTQSNGLSMEHWQIS